MMTINEKDLTTTNSSNITHKDEIIIALSKLCRWNDCGICKRACITIDGEQYHGSCDPYRCIGAIQ